MELNSIAMTILYFLIPCLLLFIALKIYATFTMGRCNCNVYLDGKTALVTGGNSGLGYQTALTLAGRGCRVIIADKDNCDKTKEEIVKTTGNTNVVTKQFDLKSLSSVRKLAKDIIDSEEKLHILINNAGTCGMGNINTEDGLNMGMQINHFGGFLLTHLLIDLLKRSAPSRIIFVSSHASFFNNLNAGNLNSFLREPATLLSEFWIYANSKLCNLITAKELAQKLNGSNVTANAVYPGVVSTNIFIQLYKWCYFPTFTEMMLTLLLKWFCKTPKEGVQTVIHAALSSDLINVTGKYFADCDICFEPCVAKNASFRKEIWELSEEMVKLNPNEKLL